LLPLAQLLVCWSS